MISPIFTWLNADAALVALIGSGHVYPSVIPKEYNGNAVVYTFVDGGPLNYLATVPGIENSRVQISSWADSAVQARDIYLATRNVMEQHGHVVSFNGTGYDPVSNKYSYSYDVSVWDYR